MQVRLKGSYVDEFMDLEDAIEAINDCEPANRIPPDAIRADVKHGKTVKGDIFDIIPPEVANV